MPPNNAYSSETKSPCSFTGEIIYKDFHGTFECDGRELVISLTQKDYVELLRVARRNDQANGQSPSSTGEEPLVGFSEDRHVVFFPRNIWRPTYSFLELSITMELDGYCLLPDDVSLETDAVILLKSTQMHRFLGLAGSFRQKTRTDGTIGVVCACNINAVLQKCAFSVDGTKITVSPNVERDGQKIRPSVRIQVEKPYDISMLYMFARAFISTLQFLFFRRDFYPDAITLQWIGSTLEGEIHIVHPPFCAKDDAIDRGLRDAMPWNIICPHFGKVFEAIYNGSLFLDYLPENLLGRIAVSFISIYKDSASFESAYDQKKNDLGVKTDIKRQAVLDSVAAILEKDIKANEKDAPDVADELNRIKKVLKGKTLHDRIFTALNHYDDCLAFFRALPGNAYDCHEIAKTCVKSRNSNSHGNLSRRTNPTVAFAFGVLRAVTLCMQLDVLGLTHEEIKNCIDSLFTLKQLGAKEIDGFM